MDEESWFDVENGHKILDWCINENYLIKYKGQKHSFANGYISYNRPAYPENLLLNFVDTVRISDD